MQNGSAFRETTLNKVSWKGFYMAEDAFDNEHPWVINSIFVSI